MSGSIGWSRWKRLIVTVHQVKARDAYKALHCSGHHQKLYTVSWKVSPNGGDYHHCSLFPIRTGNFYCWRQHGVWLRDMEKLSQNQAWSFLPAGHHMWFWKVGWKLLGWKSHPQSYCFIDPSIYNTKLKGSMFPPVNSAMNVLIHYFLIIWIMLEKKHSWYCKPDQDAVAERW